MSLSCLHHWKTLRGMISILHSFFPTSPQGIQNDMFFIFSSLIVKMVESLISKPAVEYLTANVLITGIRDPFANT